MSVEPTLSNNLSNSFCHCTRSRNLQERKIPRKSYNCPKTCHKTLLLIDREEDRRHVTQTGLELMTDWKIWVTHSYREGLKFAQTQLFHVILINLDTRPREVLQQLLNHPSTQNIPIILTADRLRCADIEYFSQLGVAGAIAQPYDCVNLGEQIAYFLDWQSDRNRRFAGDC